MIGAGFALVAVFFLVYYLSVDSGGPDEGGGFIDNF